MPLIAVVADVLLLIAALGTSWWWRPLAAAGNYWYGNAAFYWGMFFLALYLTWPTLKALGA
jgi:hypothetical protein